MSDRDQLIHQLFTFDQQNFTKFALQVFNYQALNNPIYNQFLQLLKVDISTITTLNQIPFLPIQFFKSHKVCSGNFEPEVVFSSSGTTGAKTSQHYVNSSILYQKNATLGFETVYGPIEEYVIFALLPSYLERKGSSLVYMIDQFIKKSKHKESGFFLNNYSELSKTVLKAKKKNTPILLIGVSFALLDLAEQFPTDLSGVIIMETGGMKGRRKEMTREELHSSLKDAFNVDQIHSEYGMTELLSQAYSTEKGVFRPSPTMKLFSREITDPLTLREDSKTGVINIVDLANIDSCSFIATDDLGKVYEDGSFEILGRLDNSDIRGCNLLFDKNL